jgi:acetylornithine deacetylase/succinyl-diaminopimelate desuccinylase-like protein
VEELRAVVAGAGLPATVTAKVEAFAANLGPKVAEDALVVQALAASHRAVFGRPVQEAVVQWHSDASTLAERGLQPVNYGLPRRDPDSELVAIEDLVRCARVYAEMIVRVCA